MKTILSFFLIGILFACSAHATECPNEREWGALKARAFFNKQSVGSMYCRNDAGISDRYGQVTQLLRSRSGRFVTYYEEQIRIASSYYDRSGRITREGPARADGRNGNWDRAEVDRLNRFSLQAINSLYTGGARESYCGQIAESLDLVLEAGSAAEMHEAVTAHPYASEHDLVDCDAEGAINTGAPPAAAAVSADPAAAVVTETPPPAPPQNPVVVRDPPEDNAGEEGDGTEPLNLLPASFSRQIIAPAGQVLRPVLPVISGDLTLCRTRAVSGDVTYCADPDTTEEPDEDP